MPLVGPLVDRWGARVVCSLGAVVMAGSLVLTGTMTSLWQFALYYGVLGALGLAATGQVVGLATLTRWFVKRRGTAVSLLSVASMAGISLLVPIVMWCILRFGWRMSFMILGVASFFITLPLAIWVLRDSPEDIGLHPDGRTPEPVAAGAAPVPERTATGDALRTPSFWQMGGGLFSCGFSMSLLSAHGIPMLTDHGYTPMFASWAMGILGGSAIGFTVMLGALSDRLGRRPVLAGIYAGRIFIFAGLFLIRDNPAAIIATAVAGGITLAGTGSMTSALTADIYGRFSVSSVFGLIFLVHQTGAAIGSALAGLLFETTGGYGAAFVLACCFLVGASIVALNIDKGARRIWRAATASATTN
jgi:MFS family permease